MTRTIELSLSVEDYVEDELSPDDAFDECSEDVDAITDMLRTIAREKGVSVEIKSVEFLEFDSSNWTHACGYFEVTYECELDLDD